MKERSDFSHQGAAGSSLPTKEKGGKLRYGQQEREGHRQRLRKKFDKSSAGCGMLDYELLELLLSYAVPRQNMRGVARDLIKRHGSLTNVFRSSSASLCRVPGVGEGGARLVGLVRALHMQTTLQETEDVNFMSNHEGVLEHLYILLDSTIRETLAMVMINSAGNVIRTELLSKGTLGHVVFDIREAVSVLLESGAAAVLLAHNHPSGALDPSREDIQITQRFVEALDPLEIPMIDHYIIAGRQFSSMRGLGVLRR